MVSPTTRTRAEDSFSGVGCRVMGNVTGSEFFNAACRVAVPRLAARAVPEMLGGLKAAGRAAIAHQGLGGLVKCALHQRMVVSIFRLFAAQPLAGRYERGLAFEVMHVPLPRQCRVLFEFDNGFNHVNRGYLRVAGFQDRQSGRLLTTALGKVDEQAGG